MKTIDKYLLSQQIGQGQYGKVYKAHNQYTNEVFAVKVIKLSRFKQIPKLTQFTLNEVDTLKKISNPNVIKFIELFNSKNNLYLVYEFCNGGNLEEYIQKYGVLKENEVIEKVAQLINAFQSLVQEGILHRDLKPSNILLHDNILKIADFGFCKTLEQGDLTQTMVGSPIYMAPEILLGEPYSFSADIWSLGVCIYEMLYGRCPYEDVTIPKLMQQIQNAQLQFPSQINTISEGLEKMIRRMLVVNPNYRITWNELFQLRQYAPPPPPPLQTQIRGRNNSPPLQRSKSQNKNVSPIRQASSPYQQIFQKKNSINTLPISNNNMTQNFVGQNLRQIIRSRQEFQAKLSVILKLLEMHESSHMPQIVLYLLKILQQELLLVDGNKMMKWSQFKVTPFYDRCYQLYQEDQEQLSQVESIIIKELVKSQIPIENLSQEQFSQNSKYFIQFLNDNQYKETYQYYMQLIRSMGLI